MITFNGCLPAWHANGRAGALDNNIKRIKLIYANQPIVYKVSIVHPNDNNDRNTETKLYDELNIG